MCSTPGAACHVKKINGWSGLYRGLLPRVCSSMIGILVNNTMLQSKQEELLEFVEELFANFIRPHRLTKTSNKTVEKSRSHFSRATKHIASTLQP
ncbi:mitochondrial carrier homolog 2-like [Pocillopora verrucosa]|uniref:mitochondrial carrier homolog 2-like n=1 Tax=Pocillopora verrucosa TaxID=203993 RepID=UPI003341F0E5